MTFVFFGVGFINLMYLFCLLALQRNDFYFSAGEFSVKLNIQYFSQLAYRFRKQLVVQREWT